jgi:hypothetical protein
VTVTAAATGHWAAALPAYPLHPPLASSPNLPSPFLLPLLLPPHPPDHRRLFDVKDSSYSLNISAVTTSLLFKRYG